VRGHYKSAGGTTPDRAATHQGPRAIGAQCLAACLAPTPGRRGGNGVSTEVRHRPSPKPPSTIKLPGRLEASIRAARPLARAGFGAAAVRRSARRTRALRAGHTASSGRSLAASGWSPTSHAFFLADTLISGSPSRPTGPDPAKRPAISHRREDDDDGSPNRRRASSHGRLGRAPMHRLVAPPPRPFLLAFLGRPHTTPVSQDSIPTLSVSETEGECALTHFIIAAGPLSPRRSFAAADCPHIIRTSLFTTSSGTLLLACVRRRSHSSPSSFSATRHSLLAGQRMRCRGEATHIRLCTGRNRLYGD